MIILEPESVIKCQSLINLGALLCLFPINYYDRVIEVNKNLEKNELYASDLEDLISLSDLLLDNDQISTLLKLDIINNAVYLNFKIKEFSHIKKDCGMGTHYLGL
jgi:hypothetical protein